MMDVLLKVRTRTGEHTFREDIYTHTLKYRRLNNELRPFRSLKRRVANIFQKQNSHSDDSKGTSTQTIVNDVESEDERSILNSNKRDSIHSDWSDLLSVNEEAEYKRYTKIEVNQILLVWLPHQLFPLLKLPRSLLFPQLKRLLKTLYQCHICPNQLIGEVGRQDHHMPQALLPVLLQCNKSKKKKKRENWSMSCIVLIISPCPSSQIL